MNCYSPFSSCSSSNHNISNADNRDISSIRNTIFDTNNPAQPEYTLIP